MSSYSMLIALILGPTVALADQSTPSPGDSELTEVTVTATKAPRALIDVPATVGVIDVERIERELSSDIKDLVRYEPGVSVRNAQSRFGLTDFNIRGIEGNRVLLEVDNVRLPDAFAIGSFSNATRDGVDVDLLKRVEIVRGSSSSLYGSNAIGGVVAFTTRDPADLLRDNAAFGGQVKLGYGEEDDGYVGSTAIAARNAVWSGLLAYTRRETGSLQNQGTNDALDASRTRANPQDSYTDSVLAKLLWEPEAGHTLRLTVEQSRTDVFADVISARTASAALTVLQLLGNDEQQRSRVGVEHEFRALGTRLFDSGEWRIYRQDSGTTQKRRPAPR
jgi:hemoglobin/transferrin/lactoferrin receptor protein